MLLLIFGCAKSPIQNDSLLTHVQLIDRNGVNETISQKDRLELYRKVDFLTAQPYEKVVRVFKRDSEGKVPALLTTYHPNGELYQYLEVSCGRAKGEYKEWYENSALRIVSHVMEGVGDLSPDAQTSWIFDGESKVFDISGNLKAKLSYEKGKLQKEALYYHANGKPAKILPYKDDVLDGEKKVYDIDGLFIGSMNYSEGLRDGISSFLGDKYRAKREEFYKKGLLITGKYWNFNGELTHEIWDGNGIRPEYESGFLFSEHEYLAGKPEGLVKMYRSNSNLETVFTIKDGQKQGEETTYYPDSNQPIFQINWCDDAVHGAIRTWYPNGKIESEKEMVQNKKQGKYIAWYEDGNMMMIEEYEGDILTNGKYFKKNEEVSTSRVVQGCGTATIYDARGNFLQKIEYQKGVPSV